MMQILFLVVEKSVLVVGILLTLVSLWKYGQRSRDWRGIAMMLFRRIPMTIEEYRFYRLGIALLFFAVVLRVVILTLWP